MSIVTKTGDKGTTVYFGKKIKKRDPILEGVGSLDELQAVLGLINHDLRINYLEKVIEDLYLIMGKKPISDRIKKLEEKIEELEKELEIGNKFLIFNKKRALNLNWMRTVVRRVERKCWILEDKEIGVYLNRLSDYIYLLAVKEERE